MVSIKVLFINTVRQKIDPTEQVMTQGHESLTLTQEENEHTMNNGPQTLQRSLLFCSTCGIHPHIKGTQDNGPAFYHNQFSDNLNSSVGCGYFPTLSLMNRKCSHCYLLQEVIGSEMLFVVLAIYHLETNNKCVLTERLCDPISLCHSVQIHS